MASLLPDHIRLDSCVGALLPSPNEGELEGLADDIRRRGVLVDLLVTKDVLLLDGHRRLAAAKLAGLTRVPVERLDVGGRPGRARSPSP